MLHISGKYLCLTIVFDEIEHDPTSKCTFPLVSRLKQNLDNTRNNTNIVVMNFHDRSMDLSERFYCEEIPDANHTCKAIQNKNALICLAWRKCFNNLILWKTKQVKTCEHGFNYLLSPLLFCVP